MVWVAVLFCSIKFLLFIGSFTAVCKCSLLVLTKTNKQQSLSHGYPLNTGITCPSKSSTHSGRLCSSPPIFSAFVMMAHNLLFGKPNCHVSLVTRLPGSSSKGWYTSPSPNSPNKTVSSVSRLSFLSAAADLEGSGPSHQTSVYVLHRNFVKSYSK